MHPFPPADAARCINLRDWAASSGCLCYSIRTKNRGSIAIFKDDVDACTDDWQLLAFVKARCNET